MKKAQGLSMTTIVVVAIALLVLIVLIAIFSGRMRVAGNELKETDTKTDELKNEFDNMFDESGTAISGEVVYYPQLIYERYIL